MVVKISYVDFHWDNHQGASGKSFEFSFCLNIPDDLKACDMWEFIHEKLKEKTQKERPFQSKDRYSIQKVELL